MTRGLSKQQRQIMAMLETKKLIKSNRGYFSTQEIIIESHLDYFLWLKKVDENPFTSTRKHHIDYPKYDKIRVSMYRALRSLERRGLVLSFCRGQTRFWAVPQRLCDREKRWVEYDKEDWSRRRLMWKWGAFIRTLPKDLHLRYKLKICTSEEWEKIKTLWEEANPNWKERMVGN